MKGARFADIIIVCFDKCEFVLKVFILVAGLLLLCSQLMLTYKPVRLHLSYVEQIEGRGIEGQRVKIAAESPEITEKSVAAAPEAPGDEKRLLVITAQEAGPHIQALVIVNGKGIPFRQDEVTLEVQEGDVLEIDARADKLRNFRISARHNDIEYPVSGTTVETDGNKVFLGKVRFKH